MEDLSESVSEKQTDKNISQDLDQVVADVLKWEKIILSLEQQDSCVRNDLKAQVERCNHLELSLKMTRADNDNLTRTVYNLQQAVENQIAYRAEAKVLKEQLTSLQDRSKQHQLDLETKIQSLQTSLSNLQTEHRKELDKIQRDHAVKVERHNEEKLKELSSMEQHIHDLVKKNEDAEKRHENAIARLQMEYEGKISVLQAKNSHLKSSKSNQSNANSDIFRKKLQHVQDESNKQIAQLKNELFCLKQKLNQAESNKVLMENTSRSMGRQGILKRKHH